MCVPAARRRSHRVVHGAPLSSAQVCLLRLATTAIGCIEFLSVGRQQQQDAEAPPPDPKAHDPLLPVVVADHDDNPAPADAAAARPAGGTDTSSSSWLTVLLGFVFFTLNSGMAIWRSNGERATVVLVGFSYTDLVVLFWCLRRYEVSEPGSVARARLKAAVWALTTALTLLFSTKVAAVMPPPVALVVWLMAFVTIAGGFIAFFCHTADGEKPRNLKLYLLDH